MLLVLLGWGLVEARRAAVRRRGHRGRPAARRRAIAIVLGVLALVGRRRQASGQGPGAGGAGLSAGRAVCGRYTLATPDHLGLRSRFGLDERVELRRRFNVAPGDHVVAVTTDRDGRPRGDTLRWGLVPHWAERPEDRARA